MAKTPFTDWTPRTQGTKDLLERALGIIEDYANQGIQLTVRQLYYRLVAGGALENNHKKYKSLIDLVGNARMAGLIDWDSIVDRGRVARRPSQWDGPADILESAAMSYRLDRWEGQDNYIEVWCEKDALSSVIEPVTEEYHLRYLACRGYASLTAIFDASIRLGLARMDGKTPVIIYLGDHDPSGMDMNRDIGDRLESMGVSLDAITVERIALNYDQVEEHQPPPNPAKEADSRAEGYISEYGTSCWELDALEPAILSQLITDAIEERLDLTMYNERLADEEADKEEIREAAKTL